MDIQTELNVTITGAAGQIGYSLIPLVLSGRTFGDNVRINLKLLDIEPAMNALSGVAMEIEDCAYPLLGSLKYGADADAMLKDADVAIFVGGFPRKAGMERKDLIEKNCNIFVAQGKALNDNASKDCKVLVVANPANTNCLTLSKYAPDIPKKNFTAMTRLDQDRASHQVAFRNRALVSELSGVIIWGNHSSTQYPDARFAKVGDYEISYENDQDWYRGEFIETVQKRGAAIINARGLSSSMSAANAASNHLRDWYKGADSMVSMAVISDGKHYDVEEDLCFSFPVKCTGNWEYEVVTGLEIDDFSKGMIETTMKELKEEKELAGN